MLPTVSATNWMVSVCEGLYPGFRFFAYDNYKLFKGIVFDGKQNDDVSMDVEEIANSDGGVTLSVKIWSANAKGFRINHYAAELSLVVATPPGEQVVALSANTQCVALDVPSPYGDGTLFHGSRFQGIRQILLQDETALVLRCQAPVVALEDQGQFAVGSTNPFIDDVYYQAMLVWVRRMTGKGSLPTSAKRCEQFSAIPAGSEYFATLTVVDHHASGLVADVVFHSASGEVYSRLLGGEVTISEALNPLFLQNKVNDSGTQTLGKVDIA